MKNIHILPTDKPSRLILDKEDNTYLPLQDEPVFMEHQDLVENQNIYITSDEEIKEGDWIIDNRNTLNKIINVSTNGYLMFENGNSVKDINCKKIILTTDQSLDGVQTIPDEFLKWFVKNPSCEEVELDSICKCTSCGSSVKSSCDYAYKCNPQIFYKIIIPKEEPKQIKCYCGHTTYCDCSPLEEPKQETLEEATKNWITKNSGIKSLLTPEFVRESFKAGYKLAQERMFSKEEVIRIVEKSRETGLTAEFLLLTEQFKKK